MTTPEKIQDPIEQVDILMRNAAIHGEAIQREYELGEYASGNPARVSYQSEIADYARSRVKKMMKSGLSIRRDQEDVWLPSSEPFHAYEEMGRIGLELYSQLMDETNASVKNLLGGKTLKAMTLQSDSLGPIRMRTYTYRGNRIDLPQVVRGRFENCDAANSIIELRQPLQSVSSRFLNYLDRETVKLEKEGKLGSALEILAGEEGMQAHWQVQLFDDAGATRKVMLDIIEDSR